MASAIIRKHDGAGHTAAFICAISCLPLQSNMHRSLKRRIQDRSLTSPPPSLHPTQLDLSQHKANIATIGSTIVALAALLFGAYQYEKATQMQRHALDLQSKALHSDRASRASENFQKYLEIIQSKPSGLNAEEKDVFRTARDNRALQLLNAVYSVGKDDTSWMDIVIWQLHRHTVAAQARKVQCLRLTSDFRELFESLAGTPKLKMCSDVTFED